MAGAKMPATSLKVAGSSLPQLALKLKVTGTHGRPGSVVGTSICPDTLMQLKSFQVMLPPLPYEARLSGTIT